MIISGLGSPSLEDYGLRKWHQIAGVLKCRTPAIYGMSNTRAGKPAALTHAALKLPAPPQIRARAPVDIVAGGGLAPSDPVGLGQAEPGSGLVPLRERVQGTVVGTHTYTHTHLYIHMHTVTPSGAEYCHYLPCVCVCVRVGVCVCVSICDSSITPTDRAATRKPAHHCSLAVFLIDILIGRFECRL